MRRMAKSNILISGMGGLGAEIAKNVVLAGVKSVTVHDHEKTSNADISTQVISYKFLLEKTIDKIDKFCLVFSH